MPDQYATAAGRNVKNIDNKVFQQMQVAMQSQLESTANAYDYQQSIAMDRRGLIRYFLEAAIFTNSGHIIELYCR